MTRPEENRHGTAGSPALPAPGPLTFRERALRLVEGRLFRIGVIALISLNAAILGLETWDAAEALAGRFLRNVDKLLLAVFCVEISIRFYAHRLRFFCKPWNVFDFLVVGVALASLNSGTSALRMFRALRMLRELRLISAVPGPRRVVSALFRALPSVFAVVFLLALLTYAFAVVATKIFGDAFPEWFGTLGRSMYTLFEIMTLDSWSSGIARSVTEEFPWAWILFVAFVIVSSYVVLNLFVAIMVDSMQALHADEKRKDAAEAKRPVHDGADWIAAELRRIHDRIDELARGR